VTYGWADLTTTATFYPECLMRLLFDSGRLTVVVSELYAWCTRRHGHEVNIEANITRSFWKHARSRL
jgi:hypothetical protein